MQFRNVFCNITYLLLLLSILISNNYSYQQTTIEFSLLITLKYQQISEPIVSALIRA